MTVYSHTGNSMEPGHIHFVKYLSDLCEYPIGENIGLVHDLTLELSESAMLVLT